MIVDNELVEKIKNNDNVVIARLYDYCRLDGMKLALGYDVDNAESLFHEAFLRAIEKIDLFDTSRDFLPWFKTILENICRRYVSREAKTIDLSFGENESEEEYSWVNDEYSHEATPEKIYIEKESEQAVRSIINELPEEQREAIFLFYYKGSSIAEIAKIQNANENTIKSRLNYSKQKIEKGVEEYQKKTGVKLYSFSPLLIVALRRSDLMKLFDSLNEKWDKALYGAAVAEVTKDTTVAATTTTTAVVATSVKAGIITKLIIGGLAAVTATIAGIAIVSGVKDNKDDKKANEVVAKVEETEESEEVLVVESVSEDVVVEKSEYEIAEEIFVSYLEENVFEEYPLVDENGLISTSYLVTEGFVNAGHGKYNPVSLVKTDDISYKKYNTGIKNGSLCFYVEDFDEDLEYEMLLLKSVEGNKVYEIYEINNQIVSKKAELVSSLDISTDYIESEVVTVEILNNKCIKEASERYDETGANITNWVVYKYENEELVEACAIFHDNGENVSPEIYDELKNATVKELILKYEKSAYENEEYFDVVNIVDYGDTNSYDATDYMKYKKSDYIDIVKNHTNDTIIGFYGADFDDDGDYEFFIHTTDVEIDDNYGVLHDDKVHYYFYITDELFISEYLFYDNRSFCISGSTHYIDDGKIQTIKDHIWLEKTPTVSKHINGNIALVDLDHYFVSNLFSVYTYYIENGAVVEDVDEGSLAGPDAFD